MLIFLQEYLWTLFFVFLFGLIGSFTLVPFRENIKYSLLAAPLAGGLLLTLGTIFFYDIAHFSLMTSALSVIGISALISIITFYFFPLRIKREELELLGFILVAAGFVTYLVNYASIIFASPGFSYMAGTDHLGYVQVADWLRTHWISQPPPLSNNLPEYSWPAFVFTEDNPRFGGYFYLAIITALRHGISMFNYDFACGVVLVIGYMGLSAVIAKKRITYILLFLGLLFNIWFLYSRSGYFAKILTYPALIYVTAIFLQTPKPLSSIQIAILALFFCTIGTFFPGGNIGLLFIALGFTYLIIRFIYQRLDSHSDNLIAIGQDAILVILFGGIMIATSGILSLPATYAVAPMDNLIPIFALLSYLFEINSMMPEMLKSTAATYLILFTLTMLIFAGIAIKKRERMATTFFVFPFLLAIVFLAIIQFKGNLTIQWISYELTGLYYPLMLCGVIQLLDLWANKPKMFSMQYFVGICACILILWSQAHKFDNDVKHFAGRKITPALQFSKVELDQLIQSIADKPVWVNGAGMDTNRALPLLVYVKPQAPNLQWSKEAWARVVGYRPWPAPRIKQKPNLIIELLTQPLKSNCQVQLKTQQYRLVQCINKAKLRSNGNRGKA